MSHIPSTSFKITRNEQKQKLSLFSRQNKQTQGNNNHTQLQRASAASLYVATQEVCARNRNQKTKETSLLRWKDESLTPSPDIHRRFHTNSHLGLCERLCHECGVTCVTGDFTNTRRHDTSKRGPAVSERQRRINNGPAGQMTMLLYHTSGIWFLNTTALSLMSHTVSDLFGPVWAGKSSKMSNLFIKGLISALRGPGCGSELQEVIYQYFDWEQRTRVYLYVLYFRTDH